MSAPPALSLLPRLARAARFAVVGLLATLAHWSSMAALMALGAAPNLATACGAFVGAAAAYPLQRGHAFASTRPHRCAVPRYLVACAAGWLANLVVFALLHGPAALPTPAAQAVTTAAVAALNYLLYARMVFDEPASVRTAG